MHGELRVIVDDFRAASERLQRLARAVPPDVWTRRPDSQRWSIAECVAHLNLTSAAYIPLLQHAIEEGRQLRGEAPLRYRRDITGWLLWLTMGPPVRFRVRTSSSFVPTTETTNQEQLDEFERMQAAQIALVEASDGLPLQKLWIASPFNPRAKYNLYSALSILPRHQHRHIWQAEQAAESGTRADTPSLR